MTLKITIEIIAWMSLIFALFWELIDDRYGDSVKKNQVFDMVMRVTFFLVSGVLHQILYHKFFEGTVLAIAVFFLCFDYLVAYLLIRNGVVIGHWFSYLSGRKFFDKIMVRLFPWQRLALRICVLIGSITFYFYEEIF